MFFSGKFGELQAKILRIPKNLPVPTPMLRHTIHFIDKFQCVVYKIDVTLWMSLRNSLLRSAKPDRHVRKASHCGSKQQQRSCTAVTPLLLVRATYILLFFAHIPFVVKHTINATPTERLQHPLVTQCFYIFRKQNCAANH